MTLEPRVLRAQLRPLLRPTVAVAIALLGLGGVCGCKKKPGDAVQAVDTAKKGASGTRPKPNAGAATGLPAAVTPSSPGHRPAPPAAAPMPEVPTAVGAAPAVPAPPVPRGVLGLPTPPPGVDPGLRLAAPAGPEAAAPSGPGAEVAAIEAPSGDRVPMPAPEADVEAPEAPAFRTPPPAASAEPPLDITGYLSVGDIDRVLGAKAKLHRAELLGTLPSPSHNFLYFKKEKGGDFGVSVQVWRDSNAAESRTRFATMRNTYSNVAPTNKVADQGFRAYFGGVVTLVFADPRRPMVAAVSCSIKTCTADQMLELSRRVAERLH